MSGYSNCLACNRVSSDNYEHVTGGLVDCTPEELKTHEDCSICFKVKSEVGKALIRLASGASRFEPPDDNVFSPTESADDPVAEDEVIECAQDS